MFGLESYKPVISALILPPLPFLLLVLIGARLILPRRGLGWLLVLLGVAGIWASTCQVTGRWLQNVVLRPPAALSSDDMARLSQLAPPRESGTARPRAKSAATAAPAGTNATTAIVVLGCGLVPRAAEYGVSDLTACSAERLRYGMWLRRQTGLPVAFSGGVGWAQADRSVQSEAEIAERIARVTYQQPLQWTEANSADTRGNAALSVKLLRDAGVREIVLVTDAWHMPRAKRNFERAAAAGAAEMRITPAPIGAFTPSQQPILDWLPSIGGAMQVNRVLHELAGLAAGA